MRRSLFMVIVCLLSLPRLATAQLLLKDGDRVALCGDSITEQKKYSVIIEAYLLATQPAKDLRSIQLGWGGERADGFDRRIPSAVAPFKPTVATLLFGMNDGGYKAFEDATGNAFRDNLGKSIDDLKAAGVRTIIVGTPGVVDVNTFKRDPKTYNQTLSRLGDIAKQLATEKNVGFVDVHAAMYDAMTKSKAKYGEAYHLGGGDGVHPAWNGHVVMAYAFLKGMGVSGDIASVEADAKDAKVVDGKSVLEIKRKDSKYPFCVTGDPANPDSTSSIMEFIPFNQELNRYTLTVKNLPAGDITVTWGPTTHNYSADQLAKGVNLAADFPNNPFVEPFAQLMNAVTEQQNYETPLTKQLMIHLAADRGILPDAASAFDDLLKAGLDRSEKLAAKAADAVKPVEHTIRLEWAAK